MAAPNDTSEFPRAAIEQAAAWKIQLADKACSDDDRRAFDLWLNAEPYHRMIFERMSALGGETLGNDPVKRSALKAMLAPMAKTASKPGRVTKGTLSGLTAILAFTAIWAWAAQDGSVRAHLAGARSGAGEVTPMVLPVGDVLTLDSRTSLDTRSSDRSVHLWRGAVMAEVKQGLDTPFVIHTAHGYSEALGTRFSVRAHKEMTVVTVVESRVKVCAASGRKDCLILVPGQSARLDAKGATRLGDVDMDTATAWSEGLLIFDDRPLAEVVDELNRYREKPVQYAASDIAGIRVTGTFKIEDPDGALDSLSAALPITVERKGAVTRLYRR